MKRKTHARIVLVMTALALFLVAAAAAGAAPTITWWTWWSPINDQWDKDYFAAIEKDVGVKVERTIYPFPDYLNALKASMMSGEGPDVFSSAGGGSPFGDFTPIMEPLEPWLVKSWGPGWKDRWGVFDVKDILGIDPMGSTMYALPMTHQVGGIIWYNTDIFKKYNLAVPKTYAELKKIADVLNANGITPIAWGAKDQWPNKDWFITVAAQVAGDKFWQAGRGEAKFTDPDLVKALEFFVQMQKDKLFSAGSWGMTQYMDAENLFAEGKAGMMITGTWDAWLTNAHPEGKDKWRGFLFPKVGAGKPQIPWASSSMDFSMNKNARDKDAAWKFISWYGTEAGAKWWTGPTTGQDAALKSMKLTWSDHPEWAKFYDWMYSLAPLAQPRETRFPEIGEATQTAVEAASVKGVPAREALQLIQDAYDKAVKSRKLAR